MVGTGLAGSGADFWSPGYSSYGEDKNLLSWSIQLSTDLAIQVPSSFCPSKTQSGKM